MTIAPSENGWKKIDGIDGTEAVVGGESRNVGCALLLKKEEEDGGALAPTPASHRRIDVATRSATMARDCCGGAAR